jgi:hypothetical protein
MRTTEEMTVTLNLEIPNRSLASSVLERWARQTEVSLKILRGRVTSETACFSLEIRGTAREVSRIVRQSAPWDAARRFLNPVPTGALA